MKREIYFEVVRPEFRQHPNEVIVLPKRATSKSVGYDIFCPVDVILEPMKPKRIFTDVKFRFPDDVCLLLNVRSSAGKIPYIIAHGVGFIESDYYENPDNDGNLGVMLLNLSEKAITIHKGDRMAQAMFIPFYEAQTGNTDTIRLGGMGSTGK